MRSGAIHALLTKRWSRMCIRLCSLLLLFSALDAAASPGKLPPLSAEAAPGAWYAIYGTKVYRLDILERGATLVLADPAAGTLVYVASVVSVDKGTVRVRFQAVGDSSAAGESAVLTGTAVGWRFKTADGFDISGDMEAELVITAMGGQAPPRKLAFFRRNFSIPQAIVHAEGLADRAASRAIKKLQRPAR